LTPEEEQKMEVVKLLYSNVVAFAIYLLNFTPFAYQERFLTDSSKRIVVCAGRQVGKSSMTAVRALWFAVTHEETNTMIVSATLRQSMMLFDKITSMIKRPRF
jgi:hypothetical protein